MKHLKYISESTGFTKNEISDIEDLFDGIASEYGLRKYIPKNTYSKIEMPVHPYQSNPRDQFVKDAINENKFAYYYTYPHKYMVNIHVYCELGKFTEDLLEDLQNNFVPQVKSLGSRVNIKDIISKNSGWTWHNPIGINLIMIKILK